MGILPVHYQQQPHDTVQRHARIQWTHLTHSPISNCWSASVNLSCRHVKTHTHTRARVGTQQRMASHAHAHTHTHTHTGALTLARIHVRTPERRVVQHQPTGVNPSAPDDARTRRLRRLAPAQLGCSRIEAQQLSRPLHLHHCRCWRRWQSQRLVLCARAPQWWRDTLDPAALG